MSRPGYEAANKVGGLGDWVTSESAAGGPRPGQPTTSNPGGFDSQAACEESGKKENSFFLDSFGEEEWLSSFQRRVLLNSSLASPGP